MASLREELQGYNPRVILNSRMKGYGDYATPEQGVPIVAPEGPWEFCMTVNDSWGYKHADHNYKSIRQVVRAFAECIGMGGNMLLGIGPRADGSFDERQEKTLLELGNWIRRHEEAIFDTDAGLPAGHFYGASTLSKDRKTLYLFVFDRPWESVAVKGIIPAIERVAVVGRGERLECRIVGGAPWKRVPGTVWIDLPEQLLDPHATVLRIELAEPLELYRGSGHAIEAN
jgi:alpha-L-fucosidase